MKKIISILIILMFMLTAVACDNFNKKKKEDITWKDAMVKYQELVDKRDDVIKLMQEKSK